MIEEKVMIASQAEYRDYLRSNDWKIRRAKKIARDATWISRELGLLRCQCGRSVHVDNVQMHHVHYRNLGEERYEDLVIACRNCHPELDRERETRS